MSMSSDLEDDYRNIRFTLGRLLEQALARSQAPARLKLCEALLTGDEQKLETAWADLLHERSRELARERGNPRADPEMLRTEAHVFIEGVALLRLAGSLGMQVQHLTAPDIPEWLLASPRRPRPSALDWRTPP
ncbi:immunity 49 family protein [Myxococcus sp. CA033]|uniref:immunity 49 family protein n=1 Tax=Myxococcus sp. CA033 TaxID=2741516 RepID=UPI001C2D40D3|nr:immunity 49 family protein [Myxococcus sp. CA033]NTX40906.1 immunity 49 family protein [Myxococcus sp. CA033]